MALTTTPQKRAELDPRALRQIVAGEPKSGKTTLMANWSPPTTLLVDTHNGTKWLEGEHMVEHPSNWAEFVAMCRDLTKTKHPYQTVVIDLVEDVWRWCDIAHAPRGVGSASEANDFQRSLKTAERVFREVIGKLLSSDLGLVFCTHVRTRQIDGVEQEVPLLDAKVYGWLQGACDVIALVDGTKRQIHTQPSSRFAAGTRLNIPSPLACNAKLYYTELKAACNPTPTPARDDATEREDGKAEG